MLSSHSTEAWPSDHAHRQRGNRPPPATRILRPLPTRQRLRNCPTREPDDHTPDTDCREVLAAAPAVRREPGARDRIRAANTAAGRRTRPSTMTPLAPRRCMASAVLTVFEDAEYAAGLAEPGSTCFVLTNTRSLPEEDAVELSTRVAASLFTLGQTLGTPVEVVSRSDSTLRGHVLPEMRAIDAARRRVTGKGFDGVLLIPAYFEAGRFTAGDIHWANVSGEPVPVGESEFAKDATFGYTSSNLREFVAEKSNGTITADQVHSISLTDIREGGPDRVAEILSAVTDGAFVVVNATDYADLEIVVLGALQAQERGKSFVYRCGPSFPRCSGRSEPQGPLTATQIWPAGHPGGHGLVVVGSHVGLTGRQVAKAQERGGLVEASSTFPPCSILTGATIMSPPSASRSRRL